MQFFLLALLLGAPALRSLGEGGADDAEALEKFKADFKAKDVAARGAAVIELAKTQSPKICAKLGSLLSVDAAEIRIAAAKGLQTQTDDRKHATAFLIAGAAANAKDPAVLAAILTSLGKVGDDSAAAEVNRRIAEENIDAAKAAVEAAGELKHPSSMDVLIKALKQCEDLLAPQQKNAGNFVGGPSNLGAGLRSGAGKDERERARMLQLPIKKALSDISRAQRADAADWEAWWKEHRATFKPEK